MHIGALMTKFKEFITKSEVQRQNFHISVAKHYENVKYTYIVWETWNLWKIKSVNFDQNLTIVNNCLVLTTSQTHRNPVTINVFRVKFAAKTRTNITFNETKNFGSAGCSENKMFLLNFLTCTVPESHQNPEKSLFHYSAKRVQSLWVSQRLHKNIKEWKQQTGQKQRNGPRVLSCCTENEFHIISWVTEFSICSKVTENRLVHWFGWCDGILCHSNALIYDK